MHVGERMVLDVASQAGPQAAGLELVGLIRLRLDALDERTVPVSLHDAAWDQLATGYSVLAGDQALTPGAAGVFVCSEPPGGGRHARAQDVFLAVASGGARSYSLASKAGL